MYSRGKKGKKGKKEREKREKEREKERKREKERRIVWYPHNHEWSKYAIKFLKF